MYGINVDADAIAKGLLDMVPELGDAYEGALAFGMLPAPLMESLRGILGDKWDAIVKEQGGEASIDAIAELGLPDMADDMRAELATRRAKWIAHVEREVTLAMYHHAEMVV